MVEQDEPSCGLATLVTQCHSRDGNEKFGPLLKGTTPFSCMGGALQGVKPDTVHMADHLTCDCKKDQCH